jgi:hypothetical protein
MTPDELSADMEDLVAFVEQPNTVLLDREVPNLKTSIRALLKAYQEQRRALEDLLALPVAARSLVHLDKGIGTKTPDAAWLRARAALNQKGDER